MTSNNAIETLKILIIDPIPLATLIESKLKIYLEPLKPVLKEEITFVYDMYGRPMHVREDMNIDTGTIHRPVNNIRGIEIIKSYINRLLIINSAWSKQEVPSVISIWNKYIIPEYQYTVEVYELIEGLLLELKEEIRAFINGEYWNIHLQRNRYSDIIIDKCIDFRIFWYHQNIDNETIQRNKLKYT